MLTQGLTHTSTLTVTTTHTAAALGSGDLSVLATPAMLALMENAAMLAVAPEIPHDSTTVGGHISSSHLKPSPIGSTVEATATLTEVKGRKLTFNISARQTTNPDGTPCDQLIGEGSHLRFVVNRETFMH